MRARYVAIGVVVGVLLSAAIVVLAGNLDPPAGPTEAASQMVTLEQVYQRLHDGSAATKMTSFTEPLAGPGSTMHTLDDIMDIAPAADNAAGAAPRDVRSDKTYWGLRTDGTWGLQTGTASAASLPTTGQTIMYGKRDDGMLQMGIDWPDPRFTDNGDGTVTDHLTGLVWLNDAACVWGETWTNALTSANGLHDGCTSCGGTDGDCGLSDGSSAEDWRLPNVRELLSLIDFSQEDPALSSGAPFSGVQASVYWSSTTSAENPNNAWGVDLARGDVDENVKTSTNFVWPVRGGP